MAFDFNKGTVIQTGKPVSGTPKPKQQKKAEDSQAWFDKWIVGAMEGAAKFSGIEKAVEFTGKAGGRIGEALAYAIDPNVREMSQGENGKNILPFTGKLLDESTGGVVRDIGGESIETAAAVAPWKLTGFAGGALAKAGKFGLAGGAIGGSKELAEQLQGDEDIDVGAISKEAVKDGLTSATLSLVFDKAHKVWQNRATKAYGKSFKPGTRNLQSDIERGRDTINTKMSKEGYSGSAQKIMDKAKSNKTKFGKEVDKLLKGSNKTVLKKDVVKDVEELFDSQDVLDDWELNLIIKQINKLPTKMNMAQANEFKRQFAGRVSPSAWDMTASRADTFRNKVYKSISGGLRKEINNKYGGEIIKKLNEKWAIANDVLGLASHNIATSQGARGLASELAQHPSFYTLLSTPFRPFTTTTARTARGQIFQKLSNLTKDDLVQRLGRYITLEGIQ